MVARRLPHCCRSAALLPWSCPALCQQARSSRPTATPMLRLLPRALLAVLCPGSVWCTAHTAQEQLPGRGTGASTAPSLLIPAYTCCMWLIAAYQVRAGDPVIAGLRLRALRHHRRHCWAFYFIAGFSFERAKVVSRLPSSPLLGDILLPGHPGRRGMSSCLLLLYWLCRPLFLTASCAVLLLQRPPAGGRRECPVGGKRRTLKTEYRIRRERPDEG